MRSRIVRNRDNTGLKYRIIKRHTSHRRIKYVMYGLEDDGSKWATLIYFQGHMFASYSVSYIIRRGHYKTFNVVRKLFRKDKYYKIINQ